MAPRTELAELCLKMFGSVMFGSGSHLWLRVSGWEYELPQYATKSDIGAKVIRVRLQNQSPILPTSQQSFLGEYLGDSDKAMGYKIASRCHFKGRRSEGRQAPTNRD